MASNKNTIQSHSRSVDLKYEQIPSVFSNTHDYNNDDNSSICTVDTKETDLSEVVIYPANRLPTAIECGIDHSFIFDKQKEQLKPFELSTTSNAFTLQAMSDGDLIHSIAEIWERTQLHVYANRISNLAWYNWVLLDISRRIFELYKRENSKYLLGSLIDTLASRIYYQPISIRVVQDGKPFAHYPLFSAERITRLIKLSAKFTDNICGASESIDFMFVLNMTKDEFDYFYYQMLQSKHILNERFKVIRGAFHSMCPMGPFKPTRFW